MAKELTAMFGERIEVLADIGGPSMTRQEFADECDINKLMERYDKVGVWPLPPADYQPVYYDFTTMPQDLMSALNMMKDAETAFMTLPASVRKEFDNDPYRFVEFAENGDNLGKLREWKLAEPEKAEDPPMRVEVVEKPGSAAKPPVAPGPAQKAD